MKFYIFISIIFSTICLSCGSDSNSIDGGDQNSQAQVQSYKKLDGKWSIEKVHDLAVDPTQLDGKQPLIIFNVTEGTFTGNDGCNAFQGKVTFKNDKINFGPVAGTLMACPHMDISVKILNSLSEKELTYALKDDMILYQGDQQVMVLKHME